MEVAEGDRRAAAFGAVLLGIIITIKFFREKSRPGGAAGAQGQAPAIAARLADELVPGSLWESGQAEGLAQAGRDAHGLAVHGLLEPGRQGVSAERRGRGEPDHLEGEGCRRDEEPVPRPRGRPGGRRHSHADAAQRPGQDGRVELHAHAEEVDVGPRGARPADRAGGRHRPAPAAIPARRTSAPAPGPSRGTSFVQSSGSCTTRICMFGDPAWSDYDPTPRAQKVKWARATASRSCSIAQRPARSPGSASGCSRIRVAKCTLREER